MVNVVCNVTLQNKFNFLSMIYYFLSIPDNIIFKRLFFNNEILKTRLNYDKTIVTKGSLKKVKTFIIKRKR